MVLRPGIVILGDEALVPPGNLVDPPPHHFTHVLVVDEPFHFDRPGPSAEPDGVLPAGTQVVLLTQGGDFCRVVNRTGLSVEVRRSSVRELSPNG